jgi:hypothetical protein
MTEKMVRATKEDKKVALGEVFLQVTLASLETDDSAPIDEFEAACAADPELRRQKAAFQEFLLGPYLRNQARKAAFIRRIVERELEVKEELGTELIGSVPDEIDYGPERHLPGSGADILPSKLG